MTQPKEPESPLPVAPGQVVGAKWRIVRLLGRGGMGAVYEAQNTSIGKRAALKFIDVEFARNPEIAVRFQREAEAASLVESAHIVHVFDSGTTDDGIPYIVMELLRGEDLRSRLRRFGRLPPHEAAHIVAQTLRGLIRAHEAGIVHRDLKPDNIFLVDRDDDPLFAKIVDFGISKVTRRSASAPGTGTLTRQGVVLGTPFYMSPEQAQALPDVDERTDLWALGAILFECLAGKPPFAGDAYEQIIVAICTSDAPDLTAIDPAIPAPLAAVVRRALSRDRSKRFGSAKEMLEALQAGGLLPVSLVGAVSRPEPSTSPAVAAPAGPARTRTSWVTGEAGLRTARVRRQGIFALGAVIMIGGFVVTLALLRGRPPPAPRPKPPAVAAPTRQEPLAPPESSAAPPAPVVVTSATPAASTKPEAAHATRPRAQPAPTMGTPATSPAAQKTGVAGGLQIKTSYP
jgi:eukaryotic-like serine/threonine-protein kinase